MRLAISTLLLLQIFLLAPFSHATEDREQRWVSDLVSNDVSLIRRAAKEIYTARAFDEKLLDVVAEVMLETYQDPPSGFIQIDALSWSANALGASRDSRYREVLAEVKENAYHKKLRKFAKKNLKMLKEDDATQYKKGSISLEKLRK